MLYRKENLEYDSETGELFRCWKNKKKQIKTKAATGYLVVRISGKTTCPLHRVVWEMVYGEIPETKVIDHIDQNKENNKIANLRLVSKSENSINSKLFSTNTSGYRGISFNKRDNKYVAEVRKGSIRIRKYGFKTLEEAVNWYTDVFQSVWGYFSNKEHLSAS